MPPTIDVARLEAEYDNRARVPEHAAIFERWIRASALARSGSTARLGLRYAPGPGGEVDLFLPVAGTVPGGQAAPVMVFIHGGYWRSLDKSMFSFVAPAFCAEGVLVAVPDYPLCPAVTIEQITLQMAHLVAWVWRHAAEHGGDPKRIVLVGHSAGGHLATMLLSCRWRDVDPGMPAAPLAGALSISGVVDLEPLRHVPSLQADLRLTPASVARLSPAFFPRPKAGKLFAVAGGDESPAFLRQNALIRDVWGPTAVPVCQTLPGLNHFTVLVSLVDPQGRLHDLALRLLGLR